MTTPEPRVRVHRKPTVFGTDGRVVIRTWCARCTGCGDVVSFGWTRPGDAADGGRRHAATCPALRLARLLRELEALRDNWRAVGQAGLDAMPYTYRNLAHHWIYRADDLTALIDRVSRPDAATPRPETAQKLTGNAVTPPAARDLVAAVAESLS